MGGVCFCSPNDSFEKAEIHNATAQNSPCEAKVPTSAPSLENTPAVAELQISIVDEEADTDNRYPVPEFECKMQEDLDEEFGLFDVTFKSRPFGFGCDSDPEGSFLKVTSIQRDELRSCGVHIGALIVGCDGTYFVEANMDVAAIVKFVSERRLPVTLHFAMQKSIRK